MTIKVLFDIADLSYISSFFGVPYDIHAFLKTFIQSPHNVPTRNILQFLKISFFFLWIYENLWLLITEEYTGTADNGKGFFENW